MNLKICLGIFCAATVLAAGCLDRKDDRDAAVSGEAGSGPDIGGTVPLDARGGGGTEGGVSNPLDASPVNLDGSAALEVGQDMRMVVDTGIDAAADTAPDLPQVADAGMPDAPTDPFVPPPADLGLDNPLAREVGLDLGPDLPFGPEAGPDLAPTTCTIGGTPYVSDATNPNNTCQVCKPASSPSAWSNADEGKTCGTGQYCNAGTCKPGCFISGTFYASAAANPSNACQTCQTAYATTSWTVSANGVTCGTGQVCSGGTCQSGCYVGGTLYGSGAVNPASACQTCQPSNNTLAFSQIPASDCSLVACGGDHSCALVSGVAKCWGSNYQGQLGVGSTATTESNVAALVAGANVGGFAIGAGSSHTCELVGGAVQCWGWNINNQMGNTSVTDSYVPSPVAAAAAGGTVQGLASGGFHNCVVTGGGVTCWGSNSYGQLGNNSAGGDSPSGVPVFAPDSGVLAVTTGNQHSCALVAGAVQCWGYNGLGDLGDITTSQRWLPVPVQGLSGSVQSIAAGSSADHTCAITNGYVYCWGFNVHGQLGDGTTTQRNSAVAVQGLTGSVSAISVGTAHTCAITDGGVWCWGSNAQGQLGNSSTTETWVPMAVPGLSSGAKGIACGRTHTCALVGTGVKCWGNNANGQLGNSSTSNSFSPVQVQAF